MKSLSLRFKTIQRLENFISDNLLSSYNNLIIQIYSPTSDIDNILNSLNRSLPLATIFGVKADNFLLNRVVIEKEIILNFLIFEDSIVESRYFEDDKSIDNYFFMDNKALYFTYSSAFITKDNFIDNISNKITLLGTFYNDFIIKNSNSLSRGMIAIKIKGNFDIDIKIVDEIEQIGRELKVDKVDKNILYHVDKLTPKKLYAHYLTNEFSHDMIQSSYSFPLLKKEKKDFQTLLVLKSYDNSVKLTGNLKEDDILQLGFAHGKSYYDEYQVQIDLLDGKFSDIFITYNSNTRENFYKKSGFEYKIATGSFSKSELVIYKNEIYNLNLSTIFLLINKNSSNKLQKKSYLKPKSDFAWDMSIVNALSNIAKVSSYELQNLNQQLEIKVATEIEKNLKKDAILIHNAKLAQMGEMMSMIAHQWKQPLSAISATSSGLHIKIELDMYERGFFLSSLAKIEEFVNHLSSTIDDFSNFFKPSKKRENIKLYKIVEKAMTIASYSLTKHSIKVEKNIDNTISVNTHINELVQVILNIVKNAENILMARDIKSPLIIFKTYKKENQIYLEISDNGGGIDEKIIDKIFEPYFSTRATKDSTGLGLYMSQLIVQESLNGKLLVENSENGAVFSIVLV